MQRVNEFVFYELAIKVHQLTELENDSKYSAMWYGLWQAREAIDEIYRQRPLNFTTPVALRLYNAISAVIPKEWADVVAKLPKEGELGPIISFIEAWEIREAAKEFETVLRTECQMMDTYFVSKKGTYSTKDLVENAHFHIPEPTRRGLPDQTKADFDQAGKCLAFDVPTAAAFHLLRGTEAVIRQYYELAVPGTKQAAPKMRNWGTYIKLLQNHGGDANILLLLTHLKDVYRNPVLHPEENFTDQRVQVLLGVCISALVLMETEIQKLRAKGGMLQFAAPDVPALAD
jgi:hypothetical protein